MHGGIYYPTRAPDSQTQKHRTHLTVSGIGVVRGVWALAVQAQRGVIQNTLLHGRGGRGRYRNEQSWYMQLYGMKDEGEGEV